MPNFSRRVQLAVVAVLATIALPATASSPPSGRLQLFNANSNLCLSPVG